MARAKQLKQIHQMAFAQWKKAFPDEDACCAYLVGHRWQGGVGCPRCGNVKVKEHGTMKWNWLCNECSPSGTNYRFSHITGTIFENTNKPLRDWFRVIHLMLTSKKGISALQIYRTLGFGSYRTAWYMCHRIRAALGNEDFRKLLGIVEVDKAFVGGKTKNRHKDKRGDGSGGTGGMGKAIVGGAVSHKGNVVARVIENVQVTTLTEFVRESVSTKVSLLCTDQWVGYKHLNKEFPQHATIDHARGQQVIGAVHTQTIEGFWSLVKRGMIGTFHKVSKKYLPLYVAEFQLRYSNRHNEDIFGEAIRGC
jgi:transposase-like protein